jgi:hypothetical protein
MSNALRAVHEQMEILKTDMGSEKSRLQRDNGRLKDLVSEMRLKSQAEIESFRAEMGRLSEGNQMELREAEEARVKAIKEKDVLKRVS